MTFFKIPKVKICLIVAIFSTCLILDILMPYLSPEGSTFHDFDFSGNLVANFLITMLVFLVFAYLLSSCLYFICCKVSGVKTRNSKLGEILISHGVITQDQLDEALYVQQMYIGEILIYGGRITEEQRDHALAVQKKKYRLYGKILIDLGYSTKEDVRWAIREMNKKIGRILRNKGLITDYDMTCALSLKTCRMDSEGKIISFG